MKNNKFGKLIAEKLVIPKEIVTNIPKITWYGSGDLLFENYLGIVEYREILIRINTSIGLYILCGQKMEINEITNDDVLIKGKILEIKVDLR